MVPKDYLFRERPFLHSNTVILVLLLQVDALMMLSIIEQNYQGYNVMPFSGIHLQSYFSWMVKDFVRLSEELFLICTSVYTTVDDINSIKLKDKMRNQDIKVSSFEFFGNNYIWVLFANGKSALLVLLNITYHNFRASILETVICGTFLHKESLVS